MRNNLVSAVTLIFAVASTAAQPAFAAPAKNAAATAISSSVADARRSPANRARDRYRHPAQTLSFFGVRPDHTIVEFLPGGGWYSEILAPLVKGKGRYIPLVPSRPQAQEAAAKMLADKRDWFGPTSVATVDLATGTSTIAPGSADVVLTFRNVHNLIMNDGNASAKAFASFYAALKPGGVLGVVDHRLPEDRDAALEKSSGYIKRSTIIRLAEAAGFTLAAESPVNANPKDTADWPKGVWTLPPTLRNGDVDRAKYIAIGESDRLTLKFVKPAR